MRSRRDPLGIKSSGLSCGLDVGGEGEGGVK